MANGESNPLDWGAVAVEPPPPGESPESWGAVPVPGLIDRAKLNAQVGFSESGMGLLARSPMGATMKALPAGMGPGLDTAGGLFRLFDAPTSGDEAQALRDRYARMPDAQGFLERSAAVAGYVGGSAPSPENIVPIGRGATVLRRAGQAGLAAAGTNLALDAGMQSADMAQGLQDEFSFKRLLANAGAGFVVGNLASLGLDGLARLRARLGERLKSPDVTPPERAELEAIEKEIEARTAAAAPEGAPADVSPPAVEAPRLNSRDRRTFRRQAEREAGPAPDPQQAGTAQAAAWEQTVARRYDELAAAELEKRTARAARDAEMRPVDTALARAELSDLEAVLKANQAAGPDIASVAKEMSDTTANQIAFADQLKHLDRIKAGALPPEPTQAMSPQARRMAEQYGRISPQLMGSLAGGAVGGVVGSTQGDTLEERVDNALLGAGIGATSPWLLVRVARRRKAPTGPALPREVEDFAKAFAERQGPGVMERVRAVPRQFYQALFAEHAPLARAERVLRERAGLPAATLPLARKFELLRGAAGQAEADIVRFDKAVAEPVKGMEREFNVWLALKRTEDRLAKDATGRKVGNYSLEDARRMLGKLEEHMGPERRALFEATGAAYQRHMDDALRLQLQSGRLSQEAYDAIKGMNDFYAPFRVLKHVDDADVGGGRIGPPGELAQRIRGVEAEDFKIADIMVASRENLYRSRILAEKNLKMQELAGLQRLDTKGEFVRLGKADGPVPKGFERAKVFIAGQEVPLLVNREIAAAVNGLNATQTSLAAKLAAKASTPFRLGATGANVSFQAVNLLFSDLPRLALVSKYGLAAGSTLPMRVMNTIRLPLDYAQAIASSVRGNFGRPDPLYMQWLESGGARSTIQDHIRGLADSTAAGIAAGGRIRQVRGLIDGVGAIANAVEETSKLVGLKRGLRVEGWSDRLPAARQREIMERVVSEVRNYSGSPDFGRRGTHTRNANLLFMFFNARLQGVEADARRLFGADGAKVAGATWAKLGAAVGTPTVALWMVNQSPENARDYAEVPKTERENYWMIPRYDADGRPLYFKNDEGRRVREYWRIPKRETMKLFGNMTESFLDFNKERDPQALWQFGVSFMENVSPLSISGRNFEERLESLISSTNPLIKAPIEMGLGRNTFFHRDTVPMRLQGGFGGVSPELQFTESTPALFRRAAETMPDFLPERLRSPLYLEQLVQGLSAGLITQFATGKVPEGRASWTGAPGLKRFARSQHVENEPVLDLIRTEDRAETDERIVRMRTAKELWDALDTMPVEKAGPVFAAALARDPKLLDAMKDNFKADLRGLNFQDRLVQGLGIESGARARFYESVLMAMPVEERGAFLEDQRRKKLLTRDVLRQLVLSDRN